MKITNLQPQLTSLTKQDENNYTLDWGTIKKGSDRNRQLQLDSMQSQNATARTSCGGCTSAKITDNVLNINYNTNLLGRILKYVYIYDAEEKTTIKLIGNIIK